MAQEKQSLDLLAYLQASSKVRNNASGNSYLSALIAKYTEFDLYIYYTFNFSISCSINCNTCLVVSLSC